MRYFTKDVQRYKKYSGRTGIVLLLTQQGLWALFVYRVNNYVYRSGLPRALKVIFLLVGVIFQKLIEIITGISLPYKAEIGPGLYIGHFGGIIINGKARIGANCNISQGVTIGVSGIGKKRGVPVVGNRVYIGANSVVAGAIEIGDDVLIGACSLVNKNVKSGLTVLGVPAKVISNRDSEGYI
jgi:serine O-acetyltransferase